MRQPSSIQMAQRIIRYICRKVHQREELQIMTMELSKAREYEEKYRNLIPKEERPAYHLSAPIGWLNDPNGFSVYRGEYHLFSSIIPTRRRGEACIGDMQRQKILSGGNFCLLLWLRICRTTGKAASPAVRWRCRMADSFYATQGSAAHRTNPDS